MSQSRSQTGNFAAETPAESDEGLTDPERIYRTTYDRHGRVYGRSQGDQYLFPVDEDEKDTMDIWHKCIQLSRGSRRLFEAPLYFTDFPQAVEGAPLTPEVMERADIEKRLGRRHAKVLDLGTGTGIWPIAVASGFEPYGVQVTATDLFWYLQPKFIPENLTLQEIDIESEWPGIPHDFDMIYLRMLNGSLRHASWPTIYSKVLKHLKPGVGWIEHVELDFTIRSMNSSLPPNAHVFKWLNLLYTALENHGRNLRIDPDTPAKLRAAGFTDIQETRTTIYLNPWSLDHHIGILGQWGNLAITRTLDGLTMGPLTQMLGYSEAEVLNLLAHTKTEICKLAYEPYCILHTWTARRPPGEGQMDWSHRE